MSYLLFSELNEVCQHSTEFHFPSVDDQLEKIRDEVKEAVAWRQSHWGCSGGGEHLVTLTLSEQQVWIFKVSGTGTDYDRFLTDSSMFLRHLVMIEQISDVTYSLKGYHTVFQGPVLILLPLQNFVQLSCWYE
jgi:hypothetical protein